MKKYFYYLMIFLILGVSMQSCKEDKNAPANETIASQNANQSASWNQMEQQLKALDMSYGLTKNIRRSPSIPGGIEEVPNYTNWDFNNMGSAWGIAKDDLGGFCGGVGFAGALFVSNPLILGIGVCVGAAMSYLAYKDTNGTQTVINPNNPFVYTHQGNRFVEDSYAPIGSEAGDLHNCLVLEMFQDEHFVELTSMEDIYDYLCSTNISSLSNYYTSQQVNDILTFMQQNEGYILTNQADWSNQLSELGYEAELNVIKHYAYEVSQALEPYDWKRYTRDYMMVVDNAYQNNLISEESALMINGAISTLYCSKTAWNYIQPDPMFTNKYIIHTNNSWILTNNYSNLMSLLALGHVDFVGFPYIENGNIKRIYVYSESPYNMMLTDNEVLSSLYEESFYTNTTNTIQCMDNNLTCQPIANGSYPIYAATGYDNYVYIDLE